MDRDKGGEPEGVRGVRVKCNCFVKSSVAYTDEDGCYRMSGSFSSKPRYRLVFKNSSGFAIGDTVRVLGWGDNLIGHIVRIPGDHAKYVGIRIDQLGCAYMEISPDLLLKTK